ncbi:MAG: hypothetical protein GXO32_07955 [Crenarchaeota archaeon]|nr:hypothetical protein [Thermoproteota archaeon]
MGSEVYVFDVDGVLLDVRERLERARSLARSREDFWRIFFSESLLDLDRPRQVAISMLLDRARRGLVAIVTGRPRRLLRRTIDQLTNLCGVPRSAIWRIEMRGEGDYRPGWVVKLERILGIVYEGYEVAEVHDDDEELLYRLRRHLPRARLYLHRGDSFEIL